MKNNKLLIKIYISLLMGCIISIMILAILGNIKRIGYLNEFVFDEWHINNTLELNGLSNIIKEFTLDGKLDEQSIKQFIFTNESITNYSYGFRIKYYSKVFRNSDIYGVYVDTNKIIQDNSFIKELKMDDNGSPFGNLISTKIINYDEKIDNINYILKIKAYFIILVLTILITLILFSYLAINFIIFLKSTNFTITDNYYNADITNYKILNKYTITDIAFFIYILFIFSLIFAYFYSFEIRRDDWQFQTNYKGWYNIFDFYSGFWQRGRHTSEILGVIYMRPLGRILVILGIDPFIAQKISKAFIDVLYYLLVSVITSYYIFILNNKRLFKLIFLMISLFICNIILRNDPSGFYSNAYYSMYIGSAGLALSIWFPIFYYYIYEKEIYIIKNKIYNYIIFTFLIYFASFTMEAVSFFIMGMSFFTLIFLLFIKKKFNISILYLTSLYTIYTIISFLLTYLPSGSRGQNYVNHTSFNVLENIKKNFFLYNDYFDIIMIICSIICLLILISNSIKNRNITKDHYVILYLLFISVCGIIGFYAIGTRVVWFEKIMLFSALSFLLIKNTKSRNKVLSSIFSFILVSLIIYLSFSIFLKYDNYYQMVLTTKTSDKILLERFIEADKLGKKEIIITKSDIENTSLKNQGGLSTDPNIWPNISISEWMKEYGYTKDLIYLKYIDE